jgi:hypothetical protein
LTASEKNKIKKSRLLRRERRKNVEWKLKSEEMIVDRHNSHLRGDVASLLPEVLAEIESHGRKFFIHEHDFGRIVGETICVPTGPGDEIVYAKRPRRFGLTRFVKNRKPESCSKAVVILKRDDYEDYYILITAFVGHRPEPEPWDTKNFARQPNPAEAERRAREFWSSHALVWGSEPVILGTETTVCPW